MPVIAAGDVRLLRRAQAVDVRLYGDNPARDALLEGRRVSACFDANH